MMLSPVVKQEKFLRVFSKLENFTASNENDNAECQEE